MAVRTKRGKGAAGTETVYIKNMVCDRCIRVVREEFTSMGLDVRRIDLGEAEVGSVRGGLDRDAVRDVLQRNGFELIENANARLIEAVKKAVITFVHHRTGSEPGRRYTDFIASTVGRDYHSLSVLFSSVENVTIEQYYIRQRIERVKELMKYGDRTLSEIAYMMEYSSVQHLSNQFKSVTGLTPSQFKALGSGHAGRHHRLPLDKVR